MDADVLITIVFCLEIFVFGLATALFVAHEARKSRSNAAAEDGAERSNPAGMRARPGASASGTRSAAEDGRSVTARTGRAVRGPRL